MRKTLIIIVLVSVFSTGAFAQKNIVDGKIYYSGVITVDSTLKKDVLYINVKKFFVDIFKSGKDVIQLDDKEAGVVIGKGYFIVPFKANFMYTYEMQVWHLIRLAVKDGKYKYEISDFSYKYLLDKYGWQEGSLNNSKIHNYDKLLPEIDKEVQDEISEIKKHLVQKVSSDF